jgi:hypothetical protein
MPKYLTRQFGPEAPFGLIYAINPFLVILLVPLIGLFTRKVDSYSMILWGSWLSALSPFWICIAPRFWTVIMFMVTLSVGEAIYSPRVYEYTMEVSGRGVEGLYKSLVCASIFCQALSRWDVGLAAGVVYASKRRYWRQWWRAMGHHWSHQCDISCPNDVVEILHFTAIREACTMHQTHNICQLICCCQCDRRRDRVSREACR